MPSTEILSTKLYIPASRPGAVLRRRLMERLRLGLHAKLTLISAPAGFGKTTLVTAWIAADERPVAWLSLDAADSDPERFLMYVAAAVQTISARVGAGMLRLLESPAPPPVESLMTALLNDIATIAHDFVLVLDDYHVLDSPAIDAAVTFLIENQPPRMHLVITTRADPRLPLARLRVGGQLAELRATDLRFTLQETAEFLQQSMGLRLSTEDIAILEARTEGWIAGLQLAAISLHGQQDASGFIRSFSASHHYVLDYLVEEVLNRQPQRIQDFLLHTSILDRLCGSLCDAVLRFDEYTAQSMLESIQQANLFLIPLDAERRWYRYHHLFRDLLRRRLRQAIGIAVEDLHLRASAWYEANGFEIEAFQHAAAANSIERAERLISGAGVPLYFRGAARPVIDWLESLPAELLDSHPSLWVRYAWSLMAAHRNTQIEAKLQAAEAALARIKTEAFARDLSGHIAAIRAMEAAIHYQTDVIIAQARRALELLAPDNVYVRTVVMRSLAIAYQFQGERGAARDAYHQAIVMSEASGNRFIHILATTGLGIIEESENQLYQAAQLYQRVLDLVGDPNQPIACAAYLGLARIHYEWNDLETAREYGEHGVRLAQQIESIDSAAGGMIFLARLTLIQGDPAGAASILDEVEQVIVRGAFDKQRPVAAALRVLLFLHLGDMQSAAQLAWTYDVPLSQARIRMAQAKPVDALDVVTSYERRMAAKGWHDEQLKALVLQGLAHYQHGDIHRAVIAIDKALALAAPGGCARTFLDEGQPMQALLAEAAARGLMPDYTRKLLLLFDSEYGSYQPLAPQPLIEPLSERELEILGMIAEGLSNREIGERLVVALSTVKGHNQNIFDKLQVKRRTEAVARARELGLL